MPTGETNRVKFEEASIIILSLSSTHTERKRLQPSVSAERTRTYSPPLMALTIVANSGTNGGATLPYSSSTRHPYSNPSTQRHVLFPLSPKRALHVVSAKRFTSRTGRSDSKDRRSTTTTRDQERGGLDQNRSDIQNIGGGVGVVDNVDDGYFLPKLPGDEPCFWEGEKWDALGFFVEYMWAFGIVFSLVACGIAVATYNEGATDFKETPVYKDAIQSQELLEEPEASNPDVFESNPTEVAPSLE